MGTEASLIEQIRRLREENDELKETIRQLRCGDYPLPDWLPRFTPYEESVFRPLLSGRIVSRERLLHQIYDGDEPNEEHTVDTLLSRVRRKIAPVGLRIKNKWGAGWYLDDASMALIAAHGRARAA